MGKKKITSRRDYDLYLIALPGIIVLIIFKFLPIIGAQIAFKDFNLMRGIFGSEWVGFKHFETLFMMPEFFRVLKNTLLINLYRLVFQFPIPIILAIMIFETKNVMFKRSAQTLTYLPHFLSWVIVGAIFVNILSPESGIINKIIKSFGGDPIYFLTDANWFRSILVIVDGLKISGWSSIIYLAAMQSIDVQMFEAAQIDGAKRIQRIWHITLPSIQPTIVFIILLRIGYAMENNIEQILMFYNPLVYEVGDVIGTYVYRVGLGQMKYSFTTAVGLFQSVIGFSLLMIANYISKKFVERSLW